jgi:plasmid segregation protein ParM
MVVGIDLGFNQVKVYGSGIQFKFPALIGTPSAFEIEQYKQAEELSNIRVQVENDTYYVGNKAYETSNARYCIRPDKTNTIFDVAEYYAVLGYLHSVTGLEAFDIITGLPVEEFNLKDTIKANMTGVKGFLYNDKRLHIDCTSVSVIPQSAGAYFSYILSDDATISEDNAAGRVLVIDIGYRTTDIIVMENARYISKDSFTLHIGMKDIHKELMRRIKKVHGLQFSINDMDNICRSRSIAICGVLTDVAAMITEAMEPVAMQIIEEIRYNVPDYRKMSRILACGGTMEVVFEYFRREYEGHIELMTEPEYGNAIGYYRYGMMMKGLRK